MIIYFFTMQIGYPVYHLIRGDFSWGNTIEFFVMGVIVTLLLGIIFYFGTHIPKKKEE